MMRIMVALDGSDGARAAATWVNENLGAGGQTEVLLFSVVEPFMQKSAKYDWSGFAFIDANLIAKEQEEIEKEVARMLLEASGLFDASRFQVSTKSVTGASPAQKIVEAAEEWGADLLVVGSRGLGAWKGMLLGSVSDRVMHMARRPVLVVHPSEASDEQSRGA